MVEQKVIAVNKCTPDECRHIARQSRATHAILADGRQLKGRALLFQALGNETRLKILGLLMVQELCTCDIIEALGAAATTIAFHLQVLEDAGLITSRKVGRFTLYHLNGGALDWHRVFE